MYKQWLVPAYLENPADFPLASTCLQFSVPNHATAHTRNVVKHLKKTFVIPILILILMISESCGEVVKTTFGNHMAYVFGSENNPKEREYLLTKEIRTEVIKYHYRDEVDNERNIEFTYFPKTNTLNFGPDEFEETKNAEFKIESIVDIEFKRFHSTSDATDATEPIFFNEDYGVLAIGNVMGPTIVLLPYKSDLKTAKEIYKMTFE